MPRPAKLPNLSDVDITKLKLMILALIAARAGVGRTTAQNALREVRALGLATVQERRRRGQPSLTNLIRIS